MSIRGRLLITAVVLVAVGLLVANVATYRFLSDFLLERVDEQLGQAREPAAMALSLQERFGDHHGGPGVQLPPGTYAEHLDASGGHVDSVFFGFPGQDFPSLAFPSGLPGSDGSSEQVRTLNVTADNGSRYRAQAVALANDAGTLVVAIPLSDAFGTLNRLLVVEGVVSVAVLLLVAGLALWLVRLGLRPLEGIGETAGAIAAGDLSRRVEPANERTEVGRLGLALNSMLTQIEAAFEERRASESRLRRFVADASHELRTPLTSIRGYAELFRRGAGSRPEDLAKTMRRIEDEAERMGVLVDDLLLLARLDQGRPLEREPVDLARVVSAAVEGAQAIDPARPVALEMKGYPTVLGDEGRLRQVVDNLLDNARVHTPDGTPVRVTVETSPDHVLLSVADQGPGLSPGVAGRAFERFYRGDPARSRETGGAGLGLSIVSAIVEAHGGTVQARSNDGVGATFEVRLPIHPSASVTPPEAPSEPEPAATPDLTPHPEQAPSGFSAKPV